MKNELIDIIGKVKRMLEDKTIYRDSDAHLCADFWLREMADRQLNTQSFLVYYRLGDLTSASTIERARRKVQQMNPHLKGNKVGRLRKAEKVKEQIKQIDNIGSFQNMMRSVVPQREDAFANGFFNTL